MKSYRYYGVPCAILLAAGLAMAAADEYRLWHDQDGRKVEAVFKGIKGGEVMLGLDNGEVVPLSISKLSEADREWLKSAPQSAPSAELHVPKDITFILEDRCQSCHEEGTEKGDVRLDNLTEIPLNVRLDLMNRMQEQVFLEHMPPKEKKSQPTAEERGDLVAWLSKELDAHNASKLEGKLRMPAYGNYVDHGKLFSGDHAGIKGFTPDRRWLISEFIFNEKFNRLLRFRASRGIGPPDKNGRPSRVEVIGDSRRNGVNLTNPFLLPPDSGVRYYDTTTLDGGHLLTMLSNARESSAYMLYLAERSKGRDFPSIHAILDMEWQHEDLLAAREAYLTDFIDVILKDIYGERDHAGLLPAFVPVKVERVASGDNYKKAPFHAAVLSREEMQLMYFTMAKFQDKARSDEELIGMCERDWFNFGHDARKIAMRLTFLEGYLEEWRGQMVSKKYKQDKPPVFKPLGDGEMKLIRDTILRSRSRGDTYSAVISKCMAEWTENLRQERVRAGVADDRQLAGLVTELFREILEREPDDQEAMENLQLAKSYVAKLGNMPAVRKMIETLLLNSDFVYRSEFGTGSPDSFGRRMLSPRDAAWAIAYALTDSSPDAELMKAADGGRLATREDYAREVKRILARRDRYHIIDESVEQLGVQSFTDMPIRKLRFFREFFGYPNLMPIFKDDKRFGGSYKTVTAGLVSEADMLVEHILKKDKNVFGELLTTDEFFVFHSGDNEAMAGHSRSLREVYDFFRGKNWEKFTEDDFDKYSGFLAAHGITRVGRGNIQTFKKTLEGIFARFEKGQKGAPPYVLHHYQGPSASDRAGYKMRYEQIVKCYDLDLHHWDYPVNQPTAMPHRAGILTHPAWLIAYARNTETDPIHRGKWIREKLLAGTIPDVPITVDAVVPEDHTKTMRTRVAEKTEEAYCWKCHEGMNPLGYAFEMYDDFGRYRMEEFLEHPDNIVKKGPDKGDPHVDLRDTFKTLPVVTTGRLAGTGNANLDGDVRDAIELTTRLARSERVRQSIIRHAFRYFMGRNEMLSDSKTLIDADKAYVSSGGSFDSVIVSLLTSDSFIYRKPTDR